MDERGVAFSLIKQLALSQANAGMIMSLMHFFAWPAAIAAISISLSACQNKPAPDFVIEEPKVDLRAEQGKVAVIRPETRVVGSANAIQVVGLKTITETGKLLIEAALKNDRGRRDIVYYRVRWLDGAGVMLGQYEPWATESLEGFQQSVLVLTSPYPDAADFRFEIKSRD